jgi:nuclear GTP-binding protein
VTLELNGKPVVFIDTPGLAWQPSEGEDRERRRSQDVLLRNKGRIDRLKDPTPAVSYVVSRTETEDLMVVYGLPAFAKGDVDAFLVGIARAHGLIKRVGHPISVYIVVSFAEYRFLPCFGPIHSQGGNPDVTAAARIVLRDWSTGKFSRYAVPPARSSPGTTTDIVSPTPATMIYAGDAALLERLTPRKELRRTGNLVRLSSERIDDRALVLEMPWVGADASEGESDLDGEDEDEDEGEVEMEAIGSGTDEEEATDGADSVKSAESDGLEASVSEEEDDDDGENAGADEEGEDGDEVPPTAHSSSVLKRKRRPPATTPKQQSDPARPSKKVAFAADVVPSNKRTPKPTLLPRRPVIVTHSKKQKSDLSRPSATTPSSKKANSGVHSAGGAPMRARKPAANAPMTTAAQKRIQAASRAGEDAYDFSKFF